MKNKLFISTTAIWYLLLQSIALQAQHTVDYQYDGSGNRDLLQSTLDCDLLCGCPYDKDDWLTM
jgi:hypothetical protein